MNILLVCSAGMSTSMLVTKMDQAAKAKGIEAKIWAVGEAEANEASKEADIIMLGPQVRYLQAKMEDLVEHKKPVVSIDMASYGQMNGDKVLAQAMDNLKER